MMPRLAAMDAYPPPERTQLRQLLDELLLDDAELEAFCIDHFPAVQRRFSAGMDRLAKLNLLLVQADAEELSACLRRRQSQATPKVDAALLARLEALYEQRDAALQAGAGTAGIDEELRALKRQQRRGPRLSPGVILSGRYKLKRILGSGGFADVWEAWDRRLAQTVAVKVLHGRFAPEQTQWQRFERGARSMAKLSQRHPGFVKVLGDPAEDDGYHYFVMEYLRGGDLRSARLSGQLSQAGALAVILQVAAALHVAHEQGLVHRDVKPQNILLDDRGQGRLSDFDLVIVPDSSGSTRTGPMGTFLYAAPEELEDAKHADRRADVYSLGMTAVFALHGKDLSTRVLRNTEAFIANLPCTPALRRVLTTATAWDPAERQASAEAFCRELGAALAEPESQVEVAPASPPSASPASQPLLRLPERGEQIGKYRLERRLGSGGVSIVYEAFDAEISHRVAIKFLRPEFAEIERVRRAFLQEARLLCDIQDPGIVKIYGFRENDGGIPYVIMELLHGELLTMARPPGQALSVAEVLPLAWQVASAMAAAHAAGYVHRNLKPANIMIVPDAASSGGRRAKVLDSGVAKLLSDEEPDGSLTVIGTPAYMAPEQAVNSSTVDAKADVYALGIVLYELLAGRLPFVGDSDFEILRLHLHAPPPPLSGLAATIQASLAALVDRMLAKDKDQRPSMNELAAQFGWWLSRGMSGQHPQ